MWFDSRKLEFPTAADTLPGVRSTGLGGTGVSCPAGVGAVHEAREA